MKPDVTTWTDADELTEPQVILFDDKTRIRIKIGTKFDSLEKVLAIPEFQKVRLTTSVVRRN